MASLATAMREAKHDCGSDIEIPFQACLKQMPTRVTDVSKRLGARRRRNSRGKSTGLYEVAC
jgi:hypothetical protein